MGLGSCAGQEVADVGLWTCLSVLDTLLCNVPDRQAAGITTAAQKHCSFVFLSFNVMNLIQAQHLADKFKDHKFIVGFVLPGVRSELLSQQGPCVSPGAMGGAGCLVMW